MSFLRPGSLMYSHLNFQYLSLGIFLEWNSQEISWSVIKVVPTLEMESLLWIRMASSLCPGEARYYVTWGLAAPLRETYLRFSHQLKGIWGYCFSGAKSRLDWHHPQSCHKSVGETEKAIGFSQCCLHAFQEDKTNHIQIQLLVCLWSSSILLEPETLPKPWTGRKEEGLDGSQGECRTDQTDLLS